MGLLSGLLKTRTTVLAKLKEAVGLGPSVPPDFFERLEETLVVSDLGITLTQELVDRLRQRELKGRRLDSVQAVTAALKEELLAMLPPPPPETLTGSPHVILMVGINGAGKTTTLGKLAHHHAAQGKKVMIAACDTFRAAAIEQLEAWAVRAGVPVITQKQGADPAAVAFDALSSAKARSMDLLLIDTAGRLHTRVNLMTELKKIKSVLKKKDPAQPVTTLLVLDGTSGQNALSQAREFNDTAEIDGLVITKLDGTAKGGALFSICRELSIPVRYIGTGERIDDVEPFDAKGFTEAFFTL